VNLGLCSEVDVKVDLWLEAQQWRRVTRRRVSTVVGVAEVNGVGPERIPCETAEITRPNLPKHA
jgi:hypothetical protein